MRSARPEESHAEQLRALRELLIHQREANAGRALCHAVALGVRDAELLSALYDAADELAPDLHWFTSATRLPAVCGATQVELAQLTTEQAQLRGEYRIQAVGLVLVADDYVCPPLELTHMVEPLLAQQTLLLVCCQQTACDSQLHTLVRAFTERGVFSVPQADRYGTRWLALRLRRVDCV